MREEGEVWPLTVEFYVIFDSRNVDQSERMGLG